MTNPVDAPDPEELGPDTSAPGTSAPGAAAPATPAPGTPARQTSVPTVLVLNGPNLGRLGAREPEVYGSVTHDELVALCVSAGEHLQLSVEVRQSDDEGELLRWLHEAADTGAPVVLNAGGLTHTSVALGDACAMLRAPLVEVHISNVFARESFRQHSYVSPHARGVIAGLGVEGYVLALSWLSTTVATSVATTGA